MYGWSGWDEREEDSSDKQLWEDNWDDDNIEDEFSCQLRFVLRFVLLWKLVYESFLIFHAGQNWRNWEKKLLNWTHEIILLTTNFTTQTLCIA